MADPNCSKCAIEAEVRKDYDALIQQMLEALEPVQDEGPLGYGWKSTELLALIATARARLERAAASKAKADS